MQKIRLTFVTLPTHLPKIVTDTQVQRLGSYYLKNSTRIYNPLTEEEEKNILIPFLNLDENDKQLRLKIEEFWKSFTVVVPNGGINLEIKEDDKGPININDWLKYRFAQGHFKVAQSEKEAKTSSDFIFYITDEFEEVNRKAEDIEVKMKASLLFTELFTDKKDQLDSIIRELTPNNPDTMNENVKKTVLYNVVETSPLKFIKAMNNPKVEILGFIRELVQYGILKRVANAYYYDTNVTPLAENDDEMILFVQSKQNSGTVNQMKSKLQESRKSVPSEKVTKLAKAKKELELDEA
jgi:hypothetical protein